MLTGEEEVPMRIVIALGGNALLRRSDPPVSSWLRHPAG